MVPGGQTIRSGRNHASEGGSAGSVTALKIVRTPDTSPDHVQFTGPSTCSCVPVKSHTISVGETVTRTRIG